LQHAVPRIEIHNEIGKTLQLVTSGKKKILDAGCGNGVFTTELATVYGQEGEVIGVSNSEGGWYVGQHLAEQQELENVSFHQMDVLDLRNADGSKMEDGSLDVVIANFLLYHADSEAALQELHRVLAEGGIFIAATRGFMHMSRLWQIKKKIEEEMGIVRNDGKDPSESFYPEFDLEDGEARLGPYFEVLHQFTRRQESQIWVPEKYTPYKNGSPILNTDGKPLVDYGWSDTRLALLSIMIDIGNETREQRLLVEKGVDTVGKQIFYKDIEMQGYFIDYINQGFFVCRKRAGDPVIKDLSQEELDREESTLQRAARRIITMAYGAKEEGIRGH
jgi:SAM-dependent methyltransferase